jgi:hypothetical protein
MTEVAELGSVLQPLLQAHEQAKLFAKVAAAFDRSLAEQLSHCCAGQPAAVTAHARADAVVLAKALSEMPAGPHEAPALHALSAALQDLQGSRASEGA